MKPYYDLIAIGAGSAGLGVAIAMKRLGFSVLLIDRDENRIGGDCLNDGCVPSKALIHISRLIHDARRSEPFGWKAEGSTDLAAVMQYVRERQDIIREHENAHYLRAKEGLDVEIGTARFISKTEIEVTRHDGSTARTSAKNTVLCTGSIPQSLKAEGMDKVEIHTNQTIFSLEKLPEKLLIAGAGPIGIELGQAFARFGSHVTVVDPGTRILGKELPEVSALLQQRLESEGMTFMLGQKITAFTDAHTAIVEDQDGHKQAISFDVVLVAIGRTFNFDDIDLPAGGIERNDKGQLKLNDYLQTTNPHVFVAGDAAAGAPAGTRYFSHAAELHVSTIVGNLITPGQVLNKKLSYDHFSWVTFTDPEVATFGLLENELKERAIDYERVDYDFTEDDRAVIGNYQYARLIIFTRPKGINPFSTKLLGGTLIAPGAGEMVQELILALEKGLTVGDFFNKIYPYPTASRVNKSIWLDYVLDNLPGVAKKAVKWLY